MSIALAQVLRNGWAVWRRDRSLLAPLSGLFFFLPQYAVLLLVPPAPRIDADNPAARDAWSAALGDWFAAHGALFLGAALLTQFGTLAIAALYLSDPPVTLSGALGRALRLLLRYVLATLMIALPIGFIALLLLPIPGGLALAIAPIFYLLGRVCLTAPAIVAERATGAITAITRSWLLTRGHGLALTLLVGGITLAGQVIGAVLIAADAALKQIGAANPVVLAMIDAGAAASTWASMLALALVEVVLYRRLAR